MKKALLLCAALLVAGCGEKSSSEESEPAAGNPAASAENAEDTNDAPPSLRDTGAERFLKDAVDAESIEWGASSGKRSRFPRPGALSYRINESKPFTGWVKAGVNGSGEVFGFERFKDGMKVSTADYHENGQKAAQLAYKDGKKHGLETQYYENGQKLYEVTFREGKQEGLETQYYENGQKQAEWSFRDGRELSAKYWNSKGEEVETIEETRN